MSAELASISEKRSKEFWRIVLTLLGNGHIKISCLIFQGEAYSMDAFSIFKPG